MTSKFNLMEKLGFDETSRWILYDEHFQNFFNFLENNINYDNILSDNEVQLANDLESRNALFSEEDCNQRIEEFSHKFNFISIENIDNELSNLELEIENLENVQAMYEDVNREMRENLEAMKLKSSSIGSKIIDLETVEKQNQEKCMGLANQLSQSQKENKKLSNEAEDCFSRMKTPTLFMHQMPLDHYFQKTENFINYVKIYMKENFKICSEEENIFQEGILNDDVDKLDSIRKTNLHYTEKYFQTKAQNKAIEAMVKGLEVDRLHMTNLNEMKKETKELIQMNENLDIAHETLLNDLHIALEDQSIQEHEIMLNGILHRKLQTNTDRFENLKCLSETVSKSQTIAEIVWFVLQMDLEKTKARYDNTDDLITESQKCQKRIQLMKNLEFRNEKILTELNQNNCSKISEVLGNSKALKTSKSCLLEYEKFNRLLKYSINTMVNCNHYTSLNDLIANIEGAISIIEQPVNESPIRKPIMENIKYINQIFNTKMDIIKMEDLYKNVRMDFQKMSANMNDKLWKSSQLLWIWFLTKPERVVAAIEECRNLAAGSMSGANALKHLSGLKRKD